MQKHSKIKDLDTNKNKVDEKSKKNTGKLSSNKSNRSIKPMLVAVISALLIGSMLGFIMIKMITNIDLNVKNDPVTANAGLNDDENKDDTDDQTDLKVSHIDKLNAYVLQVGVFSKIENAKEWENKFKEAGFKALIWERESQYFLLAGIAGTEEQARVMSTEMKDANFDVFVKEWETNKTEKEFTSEEEKWILSFVKYWNETVESLTKENMHLSENWNNLTRDYPDNSDDITQLVNEINKHSFEEFHNINDWHKQYILLDLWYHYDAVFN